MADMAMAADEPMEGFAAKRIAAPSKPIEPVIRYYVHQPRPVPSAARNDFTQTILFNSALELESTLEKLLSANQSFFMNDQVSTFKVVINVFSSEGRYGYLETDLQSKKLVYAHLEMPKTFI